MSVLLETWLGHCRTPRSSSSSSSAGRRPLLNIGLPLRPPRRTTIRHLHPSVARDSHDVVGPPSGRPTYAASSGPWSPLENLSSPSVVSSTSDVACPLPLQLANFTSYVGDSGSSPNIRVPDFIPQRNSEHSSFHCSLSDS